MLGNTLSLANKVSIYSKKLCCSRWEGWPLHIHSTNYSKAMWLYFFCAKIVAVWFKIANIYLPFFRQKRLQDHNTGPGCCQVVSNDPRRKPPDDRKLPNELCHGFDPVCRTKIPKNGFTPKKIVALKFH
jgi:hypothetical protein